MSKFAPWDESEVEKASISYVKNQYGNNYALSGLEYESFRAGVKWAAAQIDKCETIYYRDSDHEERVIVASPECFELDTHEAKLVGVREVEK